jgi:hypothetical protein
MRRELTLLTSCLVFLAGCSDGTSNHGTTTQGNATAQKQTEHVLTWPDYDGTTRKSVSATWVLDSETLGKGEEGYRRFLDRMKTFPRGSTLSVQFTQTDLTSGKPGFLPPFQDNDFWNVAESRDIKVVLPPGGFW